MASDSEKGNERVAVKSLVDRLPAHRPEAEELLEIFMGWAADIGLDLYPAQEEAILELLDGRNVILNTPTGSGKSLVAMAAPTPIVVAESRLRGAWANALAPGR